jgi:hypothetical protein
MKRNLLEILPRDLLEYVLEKTDESIMKDTEKYFARRLCFEYEGPIPHNDHLLQAFAEFKKWDAFRFDNKSMSPFCENLPEAFLSYIQKKGETTKALVPIVIEEFRSFFQPDEDDMLNRSAARCFDYEEFLLHSRDFRCQYVEGNCIRIQSLNRLHEIELTMKSTDDLGNVCRRIKYFGPKRFKEYVHGKSRVEQKNPQDDRRFIVITETK